MNLSSFSITMFHVQSQFWSYLAANSGKWRAWTWYVNTSDRLDLLFDCQRHKQSQSRWWSKGSFSHCHESDLHINLYLFICVPRIKNGTFSPNITLCHNFLRPSLSGNRRRLWVATCKLHQLHPNKCSWSHENLPPPSLILFFSWTILWGFATFKTFMEFRGLRGTKHI